LSKKETGRLKSILGSFINHGFCYTETILKFNEASKQILYSDGTEASKQHVKDYQDNIKKLLNLDVDALTSAFATKDNKKKDNYQTRLKAKAVLGKLAMNTVSTVSATATYFYGRYLAEYPEHQVKLKDYCQPGQEFSAKQLHEYFYPREGLYWVRVAAVGCS